MRLNQLCKTLAQQLYVSYIIDKVPVYTIKVPLEKLTKKNLAYTMVDLNAMLPFHRRLSELVLQRKITNNDDEHDVCVEVEQILWKHGRDLLKKRELS